MAELANRLSGSSDLYMNNGRRPYASINFITVASGAGYALRGRSCALFLVRRRPTEAVTI